MANNRAPDFRFIFTNTVQFQFSDNDCRIIFGIDEGAGVDNMLEQLGVAMTHRTLKMISMYTSAAVDLFEKISGAEIAFDQERFKTFQALMEGAANKAQEARAGKAN